MRRMMGWSLAVFAVGLLAPVAPAQEAAPPVEEWQVRGTIAALKDGYPQVRALAASELADLLKPDAPGGPRREWKGQSASLIDEARGVLRELLKDANPDTRVEAARALARLYERGKEVVALRELLHDPEAKAGFFAADSLARLYEGTQDAAGLRDLLRDADPNASWSAAQALARLLESQKDAPALRGLLGDPDRNVRWYAGQALARLYEGTKDVAALREMLKDAGPDARREAAEALARLGEKDAEPVLRDILRDKETAPDARREAAEALARLGNKGALADLRDFLDDPRPNVRERVAETLAGAYERGKDAAGLRELLKDARPEVRDKAARALARLYAGAKDAPALRELLRDPDAEVRKEAAEALARLYETARDTAALRDLVQGQDPDVSREAAWALVRLAQADGDKTALRGFLQSPDAAVVREAEWALGRLGEKEVIPALREWLKDPDPDARRETALVLTRLGDTDLLAVLRIPYEDTSYLYWARWQAHYWGGRKPEVARVLCAYLGRPREDPSPPVSDGKTRKEGVLADLRVLREEAWEKTDSPWLREDVAQWWSWLITQEGVGWSSADEVAELKRVRDALREGTVGRRYVAGIDRVLEPFEISPSPLVRTLLVFVLLNVVAVLLALVARRLGSRGLWLPLGAFLAGLLAVSFADVGGWEYRAHTIPWLLGLLALVELGLLVGVATISPAGPMAAPLRGLTVRTGGRRQVLDRQATSAEAQLRDIRDRAGEEEYVPLPAEVRSDRRPDPEPCADPVGTILAHLTGADGGKGSVLVEGVAGCGKSALVREVMARALARFKNDPGRQPLPVLLGGGGEPVETMIEAAHLEAGDFFLVLDGVSESGPAADVLASFVNGPHGRNTPLLLAARPGHGYAAAIRGGRWMTVAPKALDAESLREFVGGSSLSEPVLAACRGAQGDSPRAVGVPPLGGLRQSGNTGSHEPPKGGTPTAAVYLPRLVRMALAVAPRPGGSASVADLYREFFLKSLEGQLPAEGERIKRLDEASRWCLNTYWRDGLRRLRYDPTDPMQRQLRQAGLLVAADASPEPREVLFADATMQSYLTAHGLAAQDRQGYEQLPRPKDAGAGPWGRGRVLLRAAADARFAGDGELFRLCLGTFTPKKELRRWLRDELARWAGQYEEDLPRRKVLAAVPGPMADRLRDVRGAGKVLAEAARAGFDADEGNDTVEALGALYAGVAPLVYDLEATGR